MAVQLPRIDSGALDVRTGSYEVGRSGECVSCGRCPIFAAGVRDCIAEQIGHEYGAILDQLAGEREKLLTNGSSSTYNTLVLRSLAKSLHTEITERKESLP